MRGLKELNWHWKSCGMRKHLCVRTWRTGNPFWNFISWLRGRGDWDTRPTVELKTRQGQDSCYCPSGSDTRFRIHFFGLCAWGWRSRDWTPRPCSCEKIIWLLFPDIHVDEIDEYGREKLQSEFTDVKPCN